MFIKSQRVQNFFFCQRIAIFWCTRFQIMQSLEKSISKFISVTNNHQDILNKKKNKLYILSIILSTSPLISTHAPGTLSQPLIKL